MKQKKYRLSKEFLLALYTSPSEAHVIHFYSTYFPDPQIGNVTGDHTVKLARDLHSFTQFLCFLSTGKCGKTMRL